MDTKSIAERLDEVLKEKYHNYPHREFERIERIISLLERVWSLSPDLRLGQLLVSLIIKDRGEYFNCPEIFYYEDDQLEKWLEQILHEHNKR